MTYLVRLLCKKELLMCFEASLEESRGRERALRADVDAAEQRARELDLVSSRQSAELLD